MSELILPPPTWHLEGDAIGAFTGVPVAERERLPGGARGLPGPGLGTAAALAGKIPLPAYRPDVIGTRLA
jgi:hypothetical protein